jgi:integrase/recombinase XerD
MWQSRHNWILLQVLRRHKSKRGKTMKDKRRHYQVTPTYAVSFDGDLNWTLLELLPEREGKDRETGEYKPYKQASTNWQEAKARAQKAAQKGKWRYIPVKLHDLRHVYAIDYLASGGNLYALQRQLGHSTIRQTEEYLAHLTPEEAERAKST